MRHPHPAALAAFLALACLVAGPASAEGPERVVTTAGQGRVEVVPDIAWLSFGVSARRSTVADARDEVAGVVDGLIRLARETGLGDEDIATAAVTVNPEFDWDPQTRQRRMLGYVVSRDIQLRLEDLARLGELTEKALALGVTDASPARFDTSRRAQVESEALAAAAKDARARAETLAGALGDRVGRATRLSAGGPQTPMPVARGEMMMAADAAGSVGPQTYATGRIVVVAHVTAEFELVAD